MSRNIRRRRVQGGPPTLVGVGAKPHRILPVQFLFGSEWLSFGSSIKDSRMTNNAQQLKKRTLRSDGFGLLNKVGPELLITNLRKGKT